MNESLRVMDELVDSAQSVRLVGLGLYVFAVFASAAAVCKILSWWAR